MLQIDETILKSYYDGSSELILEVFNEFLQSYTEITDNLNTSFQNKDYTALTGYLHFHGPMFSYLGLPNIALKFKELEIAYNNTTDYDALVPQYTELMHQIEQSEKAVAQKKEAILAAENA
jgi:hypothetical protein